MSHLTEYGKQHCLYYLFISVNKEVGLIVTDWKTQTAPFIFIMNSHTYGKGIYKSEPGGSYSQKRERLNIRLKSESEGTRITINTTVEVYFDNAVVAAGMGVKHVTTEWRPAEYLTQSQKTKFLN